MFWQRDELRQDGRLLKYLHLMLKLWTKTPLLPKGMTEAYNLAVPVLSRYLPKIHLPQVQYL